MILLTVDSVTKHFGPEPVLDGVTFDLRPGQKVGLVGPNGTGKSTLLKIIAGELDADGGTIARHPSVRIEVLEQHPEFDPHVTVWDVARSALARWIDMAAETQRLAEAIASENDEVQRARLGEQFDRLQHALAQHDAYHLDHKIQRVLDGLGFATTAYSQPAHLLSGGQQNRLLLARLLLSSPDCMLLDEPSNHLDIEATQWLEDFLASSSQTLIVVSHDRYLLDRVTNRTLELFQGTVDDYSGNFSAYWRQKAERVELERRTFERQKEEIAKHEDFIRRNAYGQKHAQAKDREKKLARIERVTPPREILAPPMRFPRAQRCGDIVMRVEHLAKGFDRPLFTDVTFDVLRGQRWGILGPNGSGKTTLLRCLLDLLPVNEGRVVIGTGVRLAYFDQMLTGIDPDAEVIDAVRPSHKEFVEQQRRDLLARFGITGDMVFQRVGSLSGGERTRVALARLSATDANLLILDEPTNHLDLWARDALELALSAFDGTVIMVSHDRYLLNRLVDHLLVMEPAGVRRVEGNYDTYLHQQRERTAQSQSASQASRNARPSGRTKKPAASKRKFPFRKLEEIEQEIFQREARMQEIHTQLSQPDVLRDGDLVRSLRGELDAQQEALAPLYEQWEEVSEAS